MRYFKSLGLTTAERFGSPKISAESLARATGSGGAIATPESIRDAAEQAAFVSSLRECRQVGGSVGRLYTNRYGVETCTLNPVGDRANELRAALKIVPPLVPASPVRWVDGKWLPIVPKSPPKINPAYLRLLLATQGGSIPGEHAANEARISYKLEKGTAGDNGPWFRAMLEEAAKKGGAAGAANYTKISMELNQGKLPTVIRPLPPAELESAIQQMAATYNTGGSQATKVARATSVEGEQALRLSLAIAARVQAALGAAVAAEANQDYDFCLNTVGLPESAVPCCMEFVANQAQGSRNERYATYRTLIGRQDPSVMACIRGAQDVGKQASQKRLLMLAGGVGVVLVGALLLKGKRK